MATRSRPPLDRLLLAYDELELYDEAPETCHAGIISRPRHQWHHGRHHSNFAGAGPSQP
jgi:hypothetical protein